MSRRHVTPTGDSGPLQALAQRDPEELPGRGPDAGELARPWREEQRMSYLLAPRGSDAFCRKPRR